eukprot:Gb_01496 [translate_table: standard]
MGNRLSRSKRRTDASRVPVPVTGLSAPTQSSQPTHAAQLLEINNADDLTPLIAFIEDLFSTLKMSSHSAQQQSTSTGTYTSEIVKSHIKFAAYLMDNISSEGKKLQNDTATLVSRFPGEALRVVTDAMKGAGNLHWIAVGFSVIAFVLETMQRVSSNVEKALQLLDKIMDLAKILRKLYERMPNETDKLNKAVHTIVQGAMISCSYIEGRKIFRYLSATTMEESFKETRTNLSELTEELNLMVGMDNQEQIPRRKEQSQMEILRIEPVGISNGAARVTELLDMENKGGSAARAVIIYGFGGVGKTTLAEYVVARKLPSLKDLKLKYSVLRLDERKVKVKKLQEQILYDVGGEKVDLRDHHEGQQRLAAVLENQPAFLFIDNVTGKNQIRDLLPQQLSLPPESRMLITSIQSDVKVNGLDIEWREYSMDFLSDAIAKQLLRDTVLKNGHVRRVDDESERIDKIAEACGGVPLLLKVYGEHLWEDGSESSFDAALASPQKGEQGVYEQDALGEKLLFVFHTMKDQETKDAFLDICTFFHEWPRDEVSCIVGESKLKALQKGALLTINEKSRVIIHDVLRAMGKSLAKGTRFRSLECLKATLEEQDIEKLKTIKGIWIDEEKSDFSIESKMLDSMSNSVRVLSLISGIKVDGPCKRKFENLVYLQLGQSFADFPFQDGLRGLDKLTCLECTTLVEVRLLLFNIHIPIKL